MNGKPNIGIIGRGYVGSAIEFLFNNITNIRIYDVDTTKSKNTLEDTVNESEFIFICVPTPMKEDGSCDISIVDNVLSKINSDSIIIIKSTVPPNTTNCFRTLYPNLRLVVNPEFLTEKNWKYDIFNPSRIVIGGNPEDTVRVKELYELRFPHFLIYETTPSIAEMVKYTANAFLSTKVSFFNEIYDICQKLGCDYDKVRTITCIDKRIGNSHSYVPGHDGKRGFGGHCFPKDINGFIKRAIELGISPTVLLSIWEKNKEIREID